MTSEDSSNQPTADTWTFSYETSRAAADTCLEGSDVDLDGLVGCTDPDCFGYCTPLCNPTIMTCDASWQRCGDGTCQPVESPRICFADCGAVQPTCGDFACQSPETIQSCPGDCS